jgi:hypothetical protein
VSLSLLPSLIPLLDAVTASYEVLRKFEQNVDAEIEESSNYQTFPNKIVPSIQIRHEFS